MNNKVDRDQHVRPATALAFGESLFPMEPEKNDPTPQSWLRRVNEFQLDPTQPREARIVPSDEAREHREGIERFLHVARLGIAQP
jgi:transcriptional regulator of acetoin/glycerol metabolism